jgi:hypothetical protein
MPSNRQERGSYMAIDEGLSALSAARHNATEFNPDEGRFFGLVDGQFKELGYFMLAELESATGPMGLHIERDLHWKPTKLREIAPELFQEHARGGEQ